MTNDKTSPHSIVIGGTKGLGLSLVKEWLRKGHHVSAIGRTFDSRNQLGNSFSFFPGDLENGASSYEAVKKATSKNGQIANLVFYQRFRGDKTQWLQEMNTALNATQSLIELSVPMFDKSGASIVVINSIAASLVARDSTPAYHVSKAGLLQLVRYYAVMLGGERIRVNSVSPGLVLKEEAKDYYRKNQSLHDLYKKIIPLDRLASADDVSAAVDFLCGPNAAYITGQNLIVDGGLSLAFQPALAREVGLGG